MSWRSWIIPSKVFLWNPNHHVRPVYKRKSTPYCWDEGWCLQWSQHYRVQNKQVMSHGGIWKALKMWALLRDNCNTGFTGSFRFLGEWIQESVAMERQITTCVFSISPLHRCLQVCYRSTIKARCFNVVEDGKLENASEKDDSMGRLTFSRTLREDFWTRSSIRYFKG